MYRRIWSLDLIFFLLFSETIETTDTNSKREISSSSLSEISAKSNIQTNVKEKSFDCKMCQCTFSDKSNRLSHHHT